MLRFREFTLSPSSFELRREDQPVPLQRIPLELLILLVERRGTVVSREEILGKLWGESVFMDAEHSINTAIKKVRSALRDDPDRPLFIQTVVGKGYRFVAAVEELADAPSQPARVGNPLSQTSSPRFAGFVTFKGRAAGALVAAALIVLVAVVLTSMSSRQSIAVARPRLKLSKLLVPDNPVVYGVNSPDGRYLAYVSTDPGGESLWVRPLKSSGNGVKVVSAALRFWGVTFSPDSESIYYVLSSDGPPTGTLWRISVRGGTAEKLPPAINAAVRFSPDGTSMLFKRWLSPGSMALVTVDSNGANERTIATSTATFPFHSYDWDAKGDGIVYSEGSQRNGLVLWGLMRLGIRGGSSERISGLQPNAIKSVLARPDGSVVFIATDEESGVDQIWEYSKPDRIQRITNDTNAYVLVSPFRGGHRLLATQWQTEDLLWVMPVAPDEHSDRHEQQVTPRFGSYGSPAWTADGRIVFSVGTSLRGTELWATAVDGHDSKLLVSGGSVNSDPAPSPDGRFIAFVSRRNGATSIWRVDIDGTNLRRVTSGTQDAYPTVTATGRWIVYLSSVSGRMQIMRVPSEGGQPEKVSDGDSAPIVSPDEKLLAHGQFSPDLSTRTIAIHSFPDGRLISQFVVPDSAACLQWSQDGKAITYLMASGSTSELRIQPIQGGTPYRLRELGPGDISYVSRSPDGKRVVLLRRRLQGELILLESAS